MQQYNNITLLVDIMKVTGIPCLVTKSIKHTYKITHIYIVYMYNKNKYSLRYPGLLGCSRTVGVDEEGPWKILGASS